MAYAKVGGTIRKTTGGDIANECCCAANCCDVADPLPLITIIAWQIAAGTGTAHICYCLNADMTCAEEVELAWAESTDGGSTWGTITYQTAAIPGTGGACDSNPAVTRDGAGDGDACDNVFVLTGLGTGSNFLIGANMRVKNVTHGCESLWGPPFPFNWDGSLPFVPATTDLMQA